MDTHLPRSLQRGLAVLEHVIASPTGCGFVELRDHLQVPNATISRLLGGLVATEWLQRDGSRYRPGPNLQHLAGREPLDNRLRRCAHAHLKHLRDACGNTTLLLQWTGGHALCLERMLHEDSVVLQQPGHVTKDLFAAPWGIFCLDAGKWEAAFRTRPRPPGAVRAHYSRERRRLAAHGYCSSPTPDKQRIGAPLILEGAVVGALVVGGTHRSFPQERIPVFGEWLCAAAQHCSQALCPAGERE